MEISLTNSDIDRQNILNNKFALERIQEYVGVPGMMFEGEYKFTKSQVAAFYGIDERTIERYLLEYESELKINGYQLIKGSRLKDLKSRFPEAIPGGAKTSNLGIFNFRAMLNLGMLLTESENARILRSKILDIVIEVINERTGGGTKFINQRDSTYLLSNFQEETYRKKFTEALDKYVNMGKFKYAYFTDKIYLAIFKEKAQEYKQVLKLDISENPRDTFYSEILTLVASFEAGLAYEIEKQSEQLQRKLEAFEIDKLFVDFSSHPLQAPLLNDARIKMASRDYHFRSAFHTKLEEYIKSLPRNEFEKFLGEQSKTFEAQLEEAKEILKRLKES